VGRTAKRVIVACRIFEPELEKISKPDDGVKILYLDQGLHMTPHKMAPAIQEQVDQDWSCFDEIVLGYGLCANGIVGVKAPEQGLYVPKSHDCIAFFMGSCEVYRKAIKKRPGTFYLTAGWIQDRKDPLSYMQDRYVPRMGRKIAQWGMKEELKHYTHFVLIKTGAGDLNLLRRQALANAKFFGKKYEEISASSTMFNTMIKGPLCNSDYVFIPQGEWIRQEMFLDLGGSTSYKKTIPGPNTVVLDPSAQAGCGHSGKDPAGAHP
jgi:hypothetical protein